MKQPVFVFGPLNEGFPNFATNKGTRVPGTFTAQVRFLLSLVGERFLPWLINIPAQGERISGQVPEVDSAALAAMDQLERVTEPDGYRRVALRVDSTATQGSKGLSAFADVREAHSLASSEIRPGPFSEYALEHAALYRPRA